MRREELRKIAREMASQALSLEDDNSLILRVRGSSHLVECLDTRDEADDDREGLIAVLVELLADFAEKVQPKIDLASAMEDRATARTGLLVEVANLLGVPLPDVSPEGLATSIAASTTAKLEQARAEAKVQARDETELELMKALTEREQAARQRAASAHRQALLEEASAQSAMDLRLAIERARRKA